jgi:hypothetical protein
MENRLKKIRRLLIFFSIALIVSGLTAIPVQWEMELIQKLSFMIPSELRYFLLEVKTGVDDTATKYPYMLYGYDWLGFAHIIIGIFFIGPIKDPVRNIWVIEAGMIACLLVFPLAFICGPLRGIPVMWRLVDCSFGVIGMIPLYYARKYTLQLEELIPAKIYSPSH